MEQTVPTYGNVSARSIREATRASRSRAMSLTGAHREDGAAKMADQEDSQSRGSRHEPRAIKGMGLLFDALVQAAQPEAEGFLERFDEFLEREYRKLEDTPGNHEEEIALLLEAHAHALRALTVYKVP